MHDNKLVEVSLDQLASVNGGQSTPPGMGGGAWSTAPNPMTGSSPLTAPGMGIRDTMQGGNIPRPGLNPSPGGGRGDGGGGGGPRGEMLTPLA